MVVTVVVRTFYNFVVYVCKESSCGIVSFSLLGLFVFMLVCVGLVIVVIMLVLVRVAVFVMGFSPHNGIVDKIVVGRGIGVCPK